MADTAKQLMTADELLLDTPFLQRIRQQSSLKTSRLDILEAVQVRFNPLESELHEIEASLAAIEEESRLRTLFRIAIQAPDLTTFHAVLVGETVSG